MRDVNFWTFTGNLTKDPARVPPGRPEGGRRALVSQQAAQG